MHNTWKTMTEQNINDILCYDGECAEVLKTIQINNPLQFLEPNLPYEPVSLSLTHTLAHQLPCSLTL